MGTDKQTRKIISYGMVVSNIITKVLERECEDLVIISSGDDVDSIIKNKEKTDLVWFTLQPEPIYQFWRLCLGGCLKSTTHIVFTDVKDCSMWNDLRIYTGCKFGSVYFMVYSDSTKPIICPSQKGMLMK